MVGHGEEVERPVELELEAAGMLDRLALGEFVRVVRSRAGAEDEGVERVAGVHVEIAEQGPSVGLLGFRGGAAAENQEDAGAQSSG